MVLEFFLIKKTTGHSGTVRKVAISGSHEVEPMKKRTHNYIAYLVRLADYCYSLSAYNGLYLTKWDFLSLGTNHPPPKKNPALGWLGRKDDPSQSTQLP